MTFDLVQAWLDMKAQLPELAIEGIGIKYIYPIFLALILLEYFSAKHLYDLKESFSGFIIGIGDVGLAVKGGKPPRRVAGVAVVRGHEGEGLRQG